METQQKKEAWELSGIINYREVAEKVLTIREEKALLDRDAAELYGVETREINQAVRNNPIDSPRVMPSVMTPWKYPAMKPHWS